MIRLQKFISDSGYCSRRKAEELIAEGKVSVNGKIINELGVKVDENDIIKVNGKELSLKKNHVYIMLNKPKGYITSVSDDRGRKTVMDLITDVKERVYPVGRLDYDTEGLLILTNDGDFTYRITHPKHNIDKTYIAAMKRQPDEKELFKLKSGIKIDDYIAVAKDVRVIEIKKEASKVLITISQGKNRQVRKMFEEIGHPLIALKRISIGKLELNKLSAGKWRYLSKKELDLIFI